MLGFDIASGARLRVVYGIEGDGATAVEVIDKGRLRRVLGLGKLATTWRQCRCRSGGILGMLWPM